MHFFGLSYKNWIWINDDFDVAVFLLVGFDSFDVKLQVFGFKGLSPSFWKRWIWGSSLLFPINYTKIKVKQKSIE